MGSGAALGIRAGASEAGGSGPVEGPVAGCSQNILLMTGSPNTPGLHRSAALPAAEANAAIVSAIRHEGHTGSCLCCFPRDSHGSFPEERPSRRSPAPHGIGLRHSSSMRHRNLVGRKMIGAEGTPLGGPDQIRCSPSLGDVVPDQQLLTQLMLQLITQLGLQFLGQLPLQASAGMSPGP